MTLTIATLREKLALATTLEMRLPLMAELARHLTRNSALLDEAETLANTIIAEVTADKTNSPTYKEHMGDAFLVLSTVAELRNNLMQAFRLSSQAQDIFLELGDRFKLLRTYQTIGYQTFQLGDHISALRIAYEQLELAQELGNKEYLCSGYNVLGLMYTQRKNYDLALEQFHLSLNLAQQLQDTFHEVYAMSNLANLSLEMRNFESSISFSVAGLVANEKLNDRIIGIALVINIGASYYEQGLFDKAMPYAHQAYRMTELGDIGNLHTRVLLLLGKIYGAKNNLLQADEHLQNALKLAEEAGNKRQISQCYDELSLLYEKKGDFTGALTYSRSQQRVQQQWFNDLTATTLENLRIVHEVNQSHREAEKERQLREEDRRYFQHLAQMKETIISTASHDLKNPLTSLKLNLDLLRKHGQLNDERGQRFLRRIEGSIDHMRKLITDLLDMAQLETGRALKLEMVEVISFVEYILDTFEVLAEQRNIRLTFQHSEELHVASFDPHRMSQVLDNLISNAIKYSPNYGEVIVKLSFEQDEMRLTVSDQGIGIPQEDLPYIFDQFYRVSNQEHATYEGTGLGLAIAKTIIEQHNGRIWVNSDRVNGSTFGFAVPAKQADNVIATSSV